MARAIVCTKLGSPLFEGRMEAVAMMTTPSRRHPTNHHGRIVIVITACGVGPSLEDRGLMSLENQDRAFKGGFVKTHSF